MKTFHLEGKLNLRTSPVVRSEILKNLTLLDELQIDLSHVTGIDSSGLAILVEAVVAARKTNRKIRLVRFSPAVLKLIRLAHLEDVFAIHTPSTGQIIH